MSIIQSVQSLLQFKVQMKRNRLITLISLALIITLAWWWRSESTPTSQNKTRPSRVSTHEIDDLSLHQPSRTPRQPSQPTGLPAIFSTTPSDPRPKWQSSLALFIIDKSTQRPVPGVKIQIQGPITLPPAWSDQDGNVSFLQLPAGFYYLTLTHDAYALARHNAYTFVQLKAQEHRELLIEVESACLASGRMISALSGEPIADAEIYPNRYEQNDPVRSDVQGRFMLHTGELHEANIYFKANGYSPREIRRGCLDGKIDLGDVPLTADWVLKGKVVDTQQEPLAGVTVQDYPREPDAPPTANLMLATTDEQGRFSLAGLPTTNEHIYFYKDGYASADAKVNSATPADFTVVMHASCTIQGLVQDQQQTPVEGVTVQKLQTFGVEAISITDEAGKFTLDNLAPGKQGILVMTAIDDVQVIQTLRTTCPPPNPPWIVTIERPSNSVSKGIVLDANEKPVSGAFIIVMVKRNMKSWTQVISGEDGRFSIRVPDDEEYTLLASSINPPGVAYSKGISGEQSNIQLKLSDFKPYNKIPKTGSVEDNEGRPILNYQYCWSYCSQKRSSDEQGLWYRTIEMPIDTPPLWIFTQDGRVARSALTPYGEPSEEDSIVVIGEGASLKAQLGKDFEGWTRVELGSGWPIFEKNLQDEIDFPLLPPGIYYLSLTAANGRRRDIRDISIQDGAPVDLGEINLDAP